VIRLKCGPVRYRVDAKAQAATRTFSHKVSIRETEFRLQLHLENQLPLKITALYAALAQDEKRNDRIFDDVLLSLEAGRRPLILTARLHRPASSRLRVTRKQQDVVLPLMITLNAQHRSAPAARSAPR
jgi:hypothetical protein